MSILKKRILYGQVKKIFILSANCAIGSARFCSSDWIIFRAFIMHFVFAVFQLSNPVGYRYLLLNISVANSHATLAYECELLDVTWHYLPSVRLDNARSVIRL